MNSWIIAGSLAAIGSFAIVALGFILKAMISSIVQAKIDEQSRWLSKKFEDIEKQFARHVETWHGPRARRRPNNTS